MSLAQIIIGEILTEEAIIEEHDLDLKGPCEPYNNLDYRIYGDDDFKRGLFIPLEDGMLRLKLKYKLDGNPLRGCGRLYELKSKIYIL